MDVDFRARVDQLFAAHGRGDYRAALAIAEEASDRFSEHDDRTTYWQACLCCRIGETARALTLLNDGLEHGLWWGRR